MKRLLVPVVLAAAAVLVFAVVNATAGGGKPKSGTKVKHAGTIHVVEHADTDAVTNGSGDQAGNVLTFGNPVFDAADQRQVGTDQGYCVRIVVGQTWECNWTTSLPDGQLTVEGPFSDTGNTVLAITGGTGAYRNARGSMRLEYHNQAGTKFDFVFDVIG